MSDCGCQVEANAAQRKLLRVLLAACRQCGNVCHRGDRWYVNAVKGFGG